VSGGATAARVLVIEDDPDLRTVLHHSLVPGGYDARGAGTGSSGLRTALDFRPQLLLLDMMLPDISGLELCRRLRALEDLPQPAVLILSARTAEMDRVAAFEVGADDYVSKPFSIRELMLRISARLKAPSEPFALVADAAPVRESIAAGGWDLELERNSVFVGGVGVVLTEVEARLLVHLVRAPGVVHTREAMVSAIWGKQDQVVGRTIDTNIKRLRHKLGAAGPVIETVRGIGYRFAEALPPRRARARSD
jgi:two-component system phosphate regulon response regulator PhoB